MNRELSGVEIEFTMKRLWSADQRAGFGGRSPLFTHPTILSSAKGSHSMHRSTRRAAPSLPGGNAMTIGFLQIGQSEL